MNTRKFFLLPAAAVVAMLAGCGSSGNGQNNQPSQSNQPNQPDHVTINVAAPHAADGLDLQALPALIKKAGTAQELETLLNQPGSINNLDLNGDGKVDYINVTEFQKDGAHGFSLTVDLGKDQNGNPQVQEVANVIIERDPVNSNQATVQVAGNQQIYGPNQYYSSQMSFGDVVLLSWLFAPHPYYVSPYYYGYYPRAYGYYAPIPVTRYRTYTRTVTQTTTVTHVNAPVVKTKDVVSPNAGKSATTIKASLAEPTQSQRAFAQRDVSKPIATGGFRPGQSANSGGNAPKGAAPARGAAAAPAKPAATARAASASRSGFGSGGKRR